MFESLASCFAFRCSASVNLKGPDQALQAFEFTEMETDFEFLLNSNSYLRVTRPIKLIGAVHPNRPGD